MQISRIVQYEGQNDGHKDADLDLQHQREEEIEEEQLQHQRRPSEYQYIEPAQPRERSDAAVAAERDRQTERQCDGQRQHKYF